MQTIATTKNAIAATALPIDLEQSANISSAEGTEVFKGILSEVREGNTGLGSSPQPVKQETDSISQAQERAQDSVDKETQTSTDEQHLTEHLDKYTANNTNNQQDHAVLNDEAETEATDTDWVAFVERIMADAQNSVEEIQDPSLFSLNDTIDSPEAVFDDTDGKSLDITTDITKFKSGEQYKAIKGEFALTLPIDSNHPIDLENGRITQDYQIVLSEAEFALIQSVHTGKIPSLGEGGSEGETLKQLSEGIINSLVQLSDKLNVTSEHSHLDLNVDSKVSEETDANTSIQSNDAQVTLLTSLLGEEQSDNEQVALKEAITGAAVSLSEGSPISLINVADQQSKANQDILQSANAHIDLVIESVLSHLSDSPEKAQLAQGLRADVGASIVEQLAKEQSKNDKAHVSLQQLVDEALSVQDGVDVDETHVGIALQASKTEQVIAIAHAITDAVVKHQVSNAGVSELSHNPAANNDAALITALDKLSIEGTTQVSEQSKLQNPIPADKAIPLHQPEGQKQVAEKIRWMVGARVTAAEIRLDPPELGSMQIRINMTGDTASVNMVVQSTQARDMLAEAQPKLREMLSEQGIDLGESFVSTQDQQGSDEQASEEGHASSHFGAEHEEDISVIEQPIQRKQSPYNIDAYV